MTELCLSLKPKRSAKAAQIIPTPQFGEQVRRSDKASIQECTLLIQSQHSVRFKALMPGLLVSATVAITATLGYCPPAPESIVPMDQRLVMN